MRNIKQRLLWVCWGMLEKLQSPQECLSHWDSMLWTVGSHGRLLGAEMTAGP